MAPRRGGRMTKLTAVVVIVALLLSLSVHPVAYGRETRYGWFNWKVIDSGKPARIR